MKNQNKKGFTIVELVIVIAVVAILAAVLIPTFASLVKKANLSADQVAVKNMNTALAAGSADIAAEDLTIEKLETILADAGFNMENGINALRSGYAICWFKDYNTIVLSEGDTVVYPTNDEKLAADFKANYANTAKVYDLRKLVNGSSVVVNGEVVGSLQAALDKGGEITLFNDIVSKDSTERLYIKSNTVINLNGHSIDFSSWTSGRLFNIETDGVELTINAEGSNIKFGGFGLVAMKGSTSEVANVKVVINGGTFEGSTDNGVFIKAVEYVNATAVLNNVVFKDNSNIDNTNAGKQVSYITNINLNKDAKINVEVNGGTYDADCGFFASNGTFDNVTITSRGYCIYGINYTVTNSSLTTKNIHDVEGATPSACVAASSDGVTTITNSTLVAEEGKPAAYVYNSGNDMTLNGCTITGTTITTDYMNPGKEGKITIDGTVVVYLSNK